MPSPRAQIITYVLITFILSWGLEFTMVLKGGVEQFGPAWIILLMWIPGAVALGYRQLAKIGFQDVDLHKAGGKGHLWAIGIPLVLALLTGLLSIPLGMRIFGPLPLEKVLSHAPSLIAILAIGAFGALGEELGWRGFLLPKLLEAKVMHPNLVSGIIWALWHLPLVTLGGYYRIDAPVLIALAYSLTIIAAGFIANHLRIHSGSVWVPTVFHTSHNFFFQTFFPGLLFKASGPNER